MEKLNWNSDNNIYITTDLSNENNEIYYINNFDINLQNNNMQTENENINIFNLNNDSSLSNTDNIIQIKSLIISENEKKEKKIKFSDELSKLEGISINYNEFGRKDLVFKRIKNLSYNFGKNLINDYIKKIKNDKPNLYLIVGIKKELIDDTSKYFNEIFFQSPLKRIFSNPPNKINKKENITLNNKEKIEILNDLNNPLLNELLNLKFIDLMNIYIYGNKDDIKELFGIQNLMLFDDFLNSTKFRNELRNINLTEEQFAKKVLKFKMIAYSDHLLDIAPRKITNLKFEKKLKILKETNFYEEIQMKYSEIIK